MRSERALSELKWASFVARCLRQPRAAGPREGKLFGLPRPLGFLNQRLLK